MPLKLVVDAVEAKLASEWDRCPVVGLNTVGDTPVDNSPFLQVSYPVANGDQLTVGAPGENVYREEGAFRIEINAKRGKGVSDGLQWADEIAAIFRAKEFGGVQTFAPSSPAIDDRNDNGKYFTLSIAVPYTADILG
ncbi:phage tail terminator-like protein [Methylobacterium sp. Leaf106]|uniref:phage tail terminator-like protein n=1 Tax=Methylobacterium sp. Leaf106 TaxID=1736255 RepID=UPI0009E68878|nr:phage tail terminator-like protein [Methylobacterium sp. Leaf106]